MITAGPTYEAIDPVRFIGNHSSGKMGIALAQEMAARGAHVQLILGPTTVNSNHLNIQTTHVTTADEMFEQAKAVHSSSDICIFAAAVADYSPAHPATEKLKKKDSRLSIELKKNVDIAAELGKIKSTQQIHIGFALETQNGEENALQKLTQKNFDLIVLNSTKDEGAGFKHDTNKVTLYFRNGTKEVSELLPKKAIASLIAEGIKKTKN